MDSFRLLMTSTVQRRIVHLVRRFDHSRLDLRPFSKKSAIEVLDAKNDGTKKPKPKTIPVPKITLISPDDSITVTLLEEAQRLAKRRNLILTKLTDFDSKTERAVYKLVSSSDYIKKTEETINLANEDDNKDKPKFKDIKLLYISAKITEHDLKTKIKNVNKLLNKAHKVKLAVTLEDDQNTKIQSTIESMVKDHGSIQQMPSKKNMRLLVITPLLKSDTSAVNNKDETSVNSQIKNT